MTDNYNLILAFVLSLLIIVGFSYLYAPPPIEEAPRETPREAMPEKLEELGQSSMGPKIMEKAVDLSPSPRVLIKNSQLTGSLALRGAKIDDILLSNYKVSTDKDSADVRLFESSEGNKPYYASYGWLSDDKGTALPETNSMWQNVRGIEVLTPENPLLLRWQNPQGLVFEREYRIDDKFLFTVTQRVINNGEAAIRLYPYALLLRSAESVSTISWLSGGIIHNGPIGYISDELIEGYYDDLSQGETVNMNASSGGWVGITDKYWLSALLMKEDRKFDLRFIYSQQRYAKNYQVDIVGEGINLPSFSQIEVTSYLFSGAKSLDVLDNYSRLIGVKHLDLAVDFGFLYFITKPSLYILKFLYSWLGNLGLAIIFVTVVIRLIFYPLSNHSFKAMNKMKHLQPEVNKLREQYGKDRAKLNQEMMALYKSKKINPASSCLPILMQLPIFYALYTVLLVSIEMRHAAFYGWIKDLSALDPTNIFTLFGLIPWDPPSLMHIGLWPLIMGVSMFVQQKLSPPPADPIQARIFMMIPIVFTIILASFPSGLVIYWTFNNLLAMAQQWWLMEKDKVSHGKN